LGTGLALKATGFFILSSTLPLLRTEGEEALSSDANVNIFGTVIRRYDFFGCGKLEREKSGTGLALNTVADDASLSAFSALAVLSRAFRVGEEALSLAVRLNGFSTVGGRAAGCTKEGLVKSGAGLALNEVVVASFSAFPALPILSRILRIDGEDALSSVTKLNGFGTVN